MAYVSIFESVGYELLLDGQRCQDIDECTVGAAAGTSTGSGDQLTGTSPAQLLSEGDPCNGGKCLNTQGSYSCVCSGGLMMGPDGKSCLDLDECAINRDVCR